MINLVLVPHTHIDFAWRDGANKLEEACETSGGEVTADQLRMMLSRNERSLYCMVEDEKPIGWGVARIDQLPNMRVFFVTDLVARNVHFERFFDLVKQEAFRLGCSRVRFAAKPLQERIYKQKLGCNPVYTILEVAL